MNKEEMISEIEIYLSHVIAKDFPLPKAIRLMYEEYKNSNKAWEKIYDEDQNYIGELNDKILDLKFKIKEQSKEIEELDKKFQYAVPLDVINDLYINKDKIKAKIKEVENREENYTFDKLTSEDIRRTIITNLEELLASGQESDQEGG